MPFLPWRREDVPDAEAPEASAPGKARCHRVASRALRGTTTAMNAKTGDQRFSASARAPAAERHVELRELSRAATGSESGMPRLGVAGKARPRGAVPVPNRWSLDVHHVAEVGVFLRLTSTPIRRGRVGALRELRRSEGVAPVRPLPGSPLRPGRYLAGVRLLLGVPGGRGGAQQGGGGQRMVFSPGSWDHPIARVMGPVSRMTGP